MAPKDISLKVVSLDLELRDWFAGQALNGLLASGMFQDVVKRADDHPEFIIRNIAKAAYQTADAMLAEREQETETTEEVAE